MRLPASWTSALRLTLPNGEELNVCHFWTMLLPLVLTREGSTYLTGVLVSVVHWNLLSAAP